MSSKQHVPTPSTVKLKDANFKHFEYRGLSEAAIELSYMALLPTSPTSPTRHTHRAPTAPPMAPSSIMHGTTPAPHRVVDYTSHVARCPYTTHGHMYLTLAINLPLYEGRRLSHHLHHPRYRLFQPFPRSFLPTPGFSWTFVFAWIFVLSVSPHSLVPD